MLDDDLSGMVKGHGRTRLFIRDFKSSCHMPDMPDVFLNSLLIFQKPTQKTDFWWLRWHAKSATAKR
jgi:hypothetical protein